MDLSELLARLDGFYALTYALIGVILLVIAALYLMPECDEDCGHCRDWRATKTDDLSAKLFGIGPPPTTYCPLHRMPRHECRDMHEDE